MDIVDFSSNSEEEESAKDIFRRIETFVKRQSEKGKDRFNKKFIIIVDGKNLSLILNDTALSHHFILASLQANSVICCRVSPKQKSEVVRLAQENTPEITLSIGDGANDVPMIMEANIGVGINGKEGTQAVRSADYAIGQFRFLQRLLFIHGRLGYRRISFFI